MKTKEYRRQVMDKVVRTFKMGLGFKTISQAKNNSQSHHPKVERVWNNNNKSTKY